jgi:hypothetical protein
MAQAVDSLWFGTRIRLLAKRVFNLQEAVDTVKSHEKDRIERADRELNTCSALLQQLCDYAEQHRVMSFEDREIVSEIYSVLEQCYQTLEERKMPWWKKALQWIMDHLPFVRRLLEWITPFLIQRSPVAGLLVAGIATVVGHLQPDKEI